MLALPDDAFSRSFDLFDFGESDRDGEKVIFEALGTDLELGMIDFDYYDGSSINSSRCSSSGTPSCASSPCSSDRDYSLQTPSFDESVFDLVHTDLDLSMDFHSCLSQRSNVKRSKHPKQEGSIQRNIRSRSKCSPKRKRRRNKIDVLLTCSECRWSELSSQKQQEVLESLIDMVSQKLGLREQLELIRIISPEADVSPNDKEFFIDFDLFDDEKFQGVCNFVKHHLFLMKDSKRPISNTDQYSRRSPKRGREVVTNSDLYNGQLKSQEKKILAKTSKQIKKEKRSGLFKKEQVLLIKEDVSSIPEEEELDVET